MFGDFRCSMFLLRVEIYGGDDQVASEVASEVALCAVWFIVGASVL